MKYNPATGLWQNICGSKPTDQKSGIKPNSCVASGGEVTLNPTSDNVLCPYMNDISSIMIFEKPMRCQRDVQSTQVSCLLSHSWSVSITFHHHPLGICGIRCLCITSNIRPSISQCWHSNVLSAFNHQLLVNILLTNHHFGYCKFLSQGLTFITEIIK